MEKPKLIIFDLDGTLVNAYSAIISSFNFTMQQLGYPRQNKRLICRLVGWGDENLLKPFIKINDLRKATRLYRAHHRTALRRHASLFYGASELLVYLRDKGYKLAIASNRPTLFSWILIRKLNLARYFKYVLCADRLKYGKPHPEILRRIMDRFALGPRDTIYVGDMVIDAQAGRRAGVRAIIVTTGSSTRAEIKKEKPYKIIGKIRELARIL
ncbi:HAD family hydrolase [bacterium]|nr:MAG: HAD family hydrolase [bacterium]